MTMEVGKNRLEAVGEVEESADLIRYYCDAFDENDIEGDDSLSASGVEPEADALYGADGARLTEIDAGGGDIATHDEVELVYSGLMEDVQGAQASAAHWEAKRLSDDDIADLGYGPDGDEDHPAN